MKKLILSTMGRYLNMLARVSPSHAGAHGFRLFCFPFRPPLKPHQKKFLTSAATSKIQVDGVDVQVYRWGSGPRKILLLHGWQSHSYRWKSMVEALPREEFTVCSLDAPGHGLSRGRLLHVPLYSRVVEACLQQEGPFDAIMGHSLGAFTAVYTLSRLPETAVTDLVLLAPPGEATEFIDFYRNTLALSDNSVKQILSHFEQVIRYPVEHFSAPGFARNLRQRGLIIHDEDDVETSAVHSINIHKSWPKSRLVLTKGLGHNLRSKDLVSTIVRFLQGDSIGEVVPESAIRKVDG